MAYFLRLAIPVALIALMCSCVGMSSATEKVEKGQPADPKPIDDSDPDVQLLKEAKINAEDANLIDWLKERSANDEDLVHLDQQVRQLGSKEFAEREQASLKLVNLGLIALEKLRAARMEESGEAARRAKDCVEQIVKDSETNIPLAAVRVLVKRKANGAVESLLRYLPYTIDEGIQEEIYYGLDGLAVSDGKIHAALAAALQDGLPARRAVAGCIIGRMGNDDQKAAVRKLLADKDPMVRLRSAQGLLAGKDKAAIPALIELLDVPKLDVAWQAEELLHYVAGDESPTETVGPTLGNSQKKCLATWQEWWKTEGPKMELAKLDDEYRRPGLLLVNESSPRRKHSVRLYGCDRKPRWIFDTPSYVNDLQFLSGQRILIAQDKPKSLIEMSPAGETLWSHKWDETPTRCLRLPNGSTFLVNRQKVTHLSGDEEEIISRTECRVDGDFAQFDQVLPNGCFLCRKTGAGKKLDMLVEFDLASGSERRRTMIERATTRSVSYDRIRTLTGGAYLLVNRSEHQIYEVDRSGKIVWELSPSTGVWDTIRLRSGNTIISSSGRLLEITPDKRVVWEVFREEGAGVICSCFGLMRLGFPSDETSKVDLTTSVPYRLKGLKSKDPVVRTASANELKKLGPRAEPSAPALIEALDDPDDSVRSAARLALYSLAPAGLPAVIKGSSDKRLHVRSELLAVLGNYKDDAETVVPLLLVALRDENATVRRCAAAGFAKLGRHGKAAVPALVKAFEEDKDSPGEEDDKTVAHIVAEALANMGPDAAPAVPALTKGIEKGDDLLRHRCFRALAAIGTAHKDVVPILIGYLKDENKVVLREGEADALGRIGPEAKEAVPSLLKAYETARHDPKDFEYIQNTVICALGRIGPSAKEAVPTLRKALKEENPVVRSRAIEALGGIGPAAKDAIPDLFALFESSSLSQGELKSLTSAFIAIGSDSIPHLIKIAEGEKEELRLEAIRALAGFGSSAKSAIPVLAKALDDKDTLVIWASFRTLTAIGSDAVPTLVDSLTHMNRDVVKLAIEALGTLGPKARDAVSLLKALAEKDASLRSLIDDSLKQIAPKR